MFLSKGVRHLAVQCFRHVSGAIIAHKYNERHPDPDTRFILRLIAARLPAPQTGGLYLVLEGIQIEGIKNSHCG
jgi:hypothetical protein